MTDTVLSLGSAVVLLLVLPWAVISLRCVGAMRNVGEVLRGFRASSTVVQTPLALAVVVAACDEEGDIAATVERFLAQRGIDLTLVVVNDRSRDATGAILDRIAGGARADPHRLNIIHNRELPPGWLGKVNACRLGAAAATAPWILFADGDVTLSTDDFLAEVVTFAEATRLDHVAVLPDTRPMGLLQEAVMMFFGQIFLVNGRVDVMEQDLKKDGAGVGAFNLVRRAAYDRIGGHEPLRLEVGDDYWLGRLLKRSGARQRIYFGHDVVYCPWQRGAWAVVKGLEKNFFAGMRFSISALVVTTLLIPLLHLGPLVLAALALAARGASLPARIFAGAPFLVQLVSFLIGWFRFGRRNRSRARAMCLYPVAAFLIVFAMWNSAWKTLRRGGVLWRGTFYPIDELRKGCVR